MNNIELTKMGRAIPAQYGTIRAEVGYRNNIGETRSGVGRIICLIVRSELIGYIRVCRLQSAEIRLMNALNC